MTRRKRAPATSPEAKETELTGLAIELAEKKLRDGTASSQLLSIILKQDVAKSRLELERLENENELLKAKIEGLRSEKRTDEVYQKALEAFQIYRGDSKYEEMYDDEY